MADERLVGADRRRPLRTNGEGVVGVEDLAPAEAECVGWIVEADRCTERRVDIGAGTECGGLEDPDRRGLDEGAHPHLARLERSLRELGGGDVAPDTGEELGVAVRAGMCDRGELQRERRLNSGLSPSISPSQAPFDHSAGSASSKNRRRLSALINGNRLTLPCLSSSAPLDAPA